MSLEHRETEGSSWKSWTNSGNSSRPDGSRASRKKEVVEETMEKKKKQKRSRRRRGRVRREGAAKRSNNEIRAGTGKGEKKVKVQRGRKQPVQVQVFYYARLSRLWHSCFEEPGNLGWTEWGVSGYPARLRSLSFFSLRHGFVASEHPLILFCRVKLQN